MNKRSQFLATVHQNISLCREHYRLVLRADEFPSTQPGQFIQIACRDVDHDHDSEREHDVIWDERDGVHQRELEHPIAFIRRPFSLAGRRDVDGGVELDIIHRVVGVGTEWMSRLGSNDRVDILGPLGNQFSLPRANGWAILVAGGVGIPPMLYLAEKLAGRRALAFCGALSRDLLPLTIIDSTNPGPRIQPQMNVEEFARHGIGATLTTDDGSFGFGGYVTQALELWLDQAHLPEHSVIYTCGPEPMMKRVAEIAAARGVECQVAVERAMACGMGTCQSCCIRVRKPDPRQPPLPSSDWCYRLTCTDGPVFRGVELLW